MKRREWVSALRLTLVILGSLAAAVLVSSFVLSEAALSVLPQCPAKKAGGACSLCGLSHSFVALSHGRLREAVDWNPRGPWVYGGFVLLALAGALAGKYTTWKHLRKSARTCTFP